MLDLDRHGKFGAGQRQLARANERQLGRISPCSLL
jgi:hypothetical protein